MSKKNKTLPKKNKAPLKKTTQKVVAKKVVKAKPIKKSAVKAKAVTKTVSKPVKKVIVKKQAPKKAVKPVKKAITKKLVIKNNSKKVVKPVAKKTVKKTVIKKAVVKTKPKVAPKKVISAKKAVKPVVKKTIPVALKKPLSPIKAKLVKKEIVKPIKPIKPVIVKEPKIKIEKPKKIKKEKIIVPKKPIVAPTTFRKVDNSGLKVMKEPSGKFEMEFVIRASEDMVFEFVSTESGLSEWFCDDVMIRDGVFTFNWDGQEQQAKLIKEVPPTYIRYQWLDKNDGSYFEFRTQKDELTNDISLIITDFADNKADEESARLLWHSQVDKLLHVLGSFF